MFLKPKLSAVVRARAQDIVAARLTRLQSMSDEELLSIGDSLDEDIVIEGIKTRCEIWGNPPSDPHHVFAVRVTARQRFLVSPMIAVLAMEGFILKDGIRTPMRDDDFGIY